MPLSLRYEHLHLLPWDPLLSVGVAVTIGYRTHSMTTSKTRMHSSRMRTVQSGSRLRRGGRGNRGRGLFLGGLLRGGLLGEVSALGVCSRGVCSQGVPTWSEGGGGGGIPACTEADPPMNWTEWLTDRCKNITFVTSLRTVIKKILSSSPQRERALNEALDWKRDVVAAERNWSLWQPSSCCLYRQCTWLWLSTKYTDGQTEIAEHHSRFHSW